MDDVRPARAGLLMGLLPYMLSLAWLGPMISAVQRLAPPSTRDRISVFLAHQQTYWNRVRHLNFWLPLRSSEAPTRQLITSLRDAVRAHLLASGALCIGAVRCLEFESIPSGMQPADTEPTPRNPIKESILASAAILS